MDLEAEALAAALVAADLEEAPEEALAVDLAVADSVEAASEAALIIAARALATDIIIVRASLALDLVITMVAVDALAASLAL